jgi:hypothetical protein
MTRNVFAFTFLGAFVFGCQALEPSLGPPRDDAGDGTLAADDAGGAVADAESDVDAGPLPPVSFKNDIRPLMERSDTDPTGHGCKKCHYSTEPSHIGTELAGLDLSTLGSLRHGGLNTGSSIVVAGDPAKSAIVQKLRGTFATGVRMPFSGPAYWSEAQIALVERWIAEGAKGADSE